MDHPLPRKSQFRAIAGPAARALIVAGWLAWNACVANASPSEQVPVGPRAIAMGGAYSSLALDASALYWNPAGISWIGHQELAGSHANLYGSNVRDDYVAFVLPISRTDALGLDWYHSGFNDNELAFGENRFDLSWGMQVQRKLSVGLTTKFLTRDTQLDNVSVSRGNGFGMDVGVLATPLKNLRVGVVAQDLFNTSIRYSDGGSSVVYPRNLRGAASYTYSNRAVFALDVDDRWHAGTEVRVGDLLAIRGGAERDRRGSDGTTFTSGLGLKASIFRFDYAFVMPPVLPATHHFGFSMAFNFNPAQVRIEKIMPKEINIFASQYKTYAHVPIGQVVVRNLSNKLLDTRMHVEIPGLMDLPTERTVMLSPGAAQTIDLLVNLNDKAMAVPENYRAPLKISASYKSERLDRTDRASSSVVVYAPGAIDWNLGAEQTAAFITAEDPVVDSVATLATRVATAQPEFPFAGRNVANAAAIFDALGALGVTYKPDPDDPYPSISQRVGAVDHVNYPRQTLAKRSGDCDDTTVLLAALLGNVGIATQLVDVPGHIFLLFDSGEHAANRLSLGVEEGLLEVVGDGVWIPVETTMIGDGFAEAWRAGAAKYATARQSGSLKLVDVREAQARIEAQIPPQAQAAPVIDPEAVMRRLTADATVMRGWRDAYLKDNFPSATADVAVSADARDKLAHVLYLAGQIDDAVVALEAEAKARPASARAHNNLGDAYAARAELPAAVAEYRHALEADPGDAGILLNCGLILDAGGDSAAAFPYLSQGLTRSGSLAAACALLGVTVEEPEIRGGTRQFTVAQIRNLLRATLGRIPRSDPLGAAGKLPTAPKSPLKPIRVITAGPRGDAVGDPDLRNFLYWRERE